MDSTVSITNSQADPSVVESARHLGADVVVLPLRQSSDRGVYSEGSLMLVKTLRTVGVDAVYLHDPDSRVFEAKKSAVTELWIPLAVGLLSSASWELVKTVLLRVGTRELRVDYTNLAEENTQVTTWTVIGDAQSVLRAIDQLRDSHES